MNPTAVVNTLATGVAHLRFVIALVLLGIGLFGPGDASASKIGSRDHVSPDVVDTVEIDPGEEPRAAVTVNLHACPVGFNSTGLDLYEIAGNCDLQAPTVSFTLYDTSGPGQSATFDWLHTWDEVDFGKIVIEQAPLEGYEPSFAYCATNEQQGFYLASSGWNDVVLEVFPEFGAYCDWYVVPTWTPPVEDVMSGDWDKAVVVDDQPDAPDAEIDFVDNVTLAESEGDAAPESEGSAEPTIVKRED